MLMKKHKVSAKYGIVARIVLANFLLIGFVLAMFRASIYYFGMYPLEIIKVVFEKPTQIRLSDIEVYCYTTTKVGQCSNGDYQVFMYGDLWPQRVFDSAGRLLYISFVGSTTYSRLYVLRKIQRSEIGCDISLMTDICN